LNAGIIEAQNGDYVKAETHFMKAKQLNSKDARAYQNLGILYDMKNEYNKALAEYQKAVSLDSTLMRELGARIGELSKM